MALGYRHTEAAKKKIREKRMLQKMKPMSIATKRKIGLANSLSNKGKKQSLTHRKNKSNSMLGEKNHFFGRKHSAETKKKLSELKLESPVKYWLGKKRDESTKLKISEKNKGKVRSDEFKKNISKRFSGENHPRWINDRAKLAKKQIRNDTAYKEWRKNVWIRDKFNCKIKNSSCEGKIVAHHIFGWKDYPDLRYDINNGITLCKFHHPKKRNDEINLQDYFIKLLKINL